MADPARTPDEFHAHIMRQLESSPTTKGLVDSKIQRILESLDQSDLQGARELPRHVRTQDEVRVLRNLRNRNARAQVRSMIQGFLSS